MMEQTFLKQHFVGRDGFIWWIGQIASEESWIANIAPAPVNTASDLPGVGERYKVRIMGYHTTFKTDLPDDDLPWASVMYPVTAGTGNRGYYENAQLAQGNFVFGFFLDGDDAQQPVIMGCIGHNEYAEVMKNVPDTPFKPFLGYSAADQSRVAKNQLKVVPTNAELPQNNPDGGVAETKVNEAVNQSTGNTVKDKGSQAQAATGKNNLVVSSPSTDTDGNSTQSPLEKIRFQLQNGIQEIEQLRRLIYDISSSLSGDINKLNAKIQNVIKKISKQIASTLKSLYNLVIENVVNTFNFGIKTLLDLIPTDYKPLGEQAAAKGASELKCAIRNLIGFLVSQVAEFVGEAIQRVINVPMCFADQFVGGFIGSAKAAVNSAIGSVLNTVSGIAGLVDSGLSIVSDVLSGIDSIFDFSFCDTKNNKSIVQTWSAFLGQGESGGQSNLLDRISSIPEQAATIGERMNDSFNFNNIDFTAMFDTSGCDTSAITCGPPGIRFFGKNGSEAAGNLVISAAGEVLGVDMQNSGFGYGSGATAQVFDNCGRGVGARVKVVLGTGNRDSIFNDLSTNLPEENSDPEDAEEGEIYFNSNTSQIRIYNGTSWRNI